MARKAFNPHSAKFDKRLISRKQNVFNRGMIKDMEPSDIPYDAVAQLINADGYKDSIKGRKGSRLHSELELPSTYLSSSNAPPELTFFELSSVNNGVGSLKPSAMGQGSTDPFNEDMVGYLIYGSYTDVLNVSHNIPFPMIIKEFVNGTEIKVEVIDEIVDAVYFSSCKIVGKINAYFKDTIKELEYYLIGRDVYTLDDDASLWVKYVLTDGRITNADSQFFKIKENIVLNNLGGMFVVNDPYKEHYVWKANSSLPQYPLGDEFLDIATSTITDPSVYNYVYTYSRLSGSVLEDRNSLDTFIELETPPFYLDGDLKSDSNTTPPFYPLDNQTDFYSYKKSTPIENSNEYTLALNNSDSRSYSFWVNLSEEELNPFLYLTLNGTTYPAYFEFSGSITMSDVADALEAGFNNISSNIRVKFISEDGRFSVYSRDNNDVIDINSGLGAVGYDLISNGVLYASIKGSVMGATLSYFRYPTDRDDITHYSIYRTKDVSGHFEKDLTLLDPTLQNNPNIYGWVGDIPVCEGFKATYTSGVLTIIDGNNTHQRMVGHFIDGVDINGDACRAKIKSVVDDKKYTVVLALNGTLETDWYVGTETVLKASKLGNEITVIGSTYTFREGQTIFWIDGTTSVISEVTDTTVKTLDTNDKDSQLLMVEPTYRGAYDTVNDIVQNGYLRYWALNTRFMQEMPNTNIGAYDSGILMTAESDSNEINYVDTNEFRSLGYHNRLNQMNNKLEAGIRCILSVNNLFCIFTATSTHNINPKQGKVLTTEFGEYYTFLPDPFLVNGSIGITHQFKWVYGDKGDVAILTAEPALRLFNGVEYQKDRAIDAVTNTELKLMSDTMVLSYSNKNGLLLWGYREK